MTSAILCLRALRGAVAVGSGDAVITEPEMAGGFGEGPPPDVIDDDDRPPMNRRRRALAFGSLALAVAALVAVGVYNHDSGRQDGPNLHGYRLEDSPCSGFPLSPLSDAIGDKMPAALPSALVRGPALDRNQCRITAVAPVVRGWATTYTGNVTVDLHKETDPAAEFERERQVDDDTLEVTAPDRVEAVRGLGDRAYLLAVSNLSQELKVLHGNAVFTFTLSGSTSWSGPSARPAPGDEPPAVRIAAYRPALIETVRHIMAALRR